MKWIASIVLSLIISAVTFAQSSKATTGKLNGHEWVDLGLPSGTLWATCNIGAESPSGYGNYYAFRGTESKTYFYVGIDYSYWNIEGDAATVNWGNGWRMPTYYEMDELNLKCKVTWTTQNGVKGKKFTGPNGNSIFLPAAGWYAGDSPKNVGEKGFYWSFSFSGGHYDYKGVVLYFDSDDCRTAIINVQYGCSARPICFSRDITNRSNSIQSNSRTNQSTNSNAGQSNSLHDGEIKGIFSISDTKKVMFSKGNLQYQGSTNKWRFAENQYTMIGRSGGNIAPSATQSGWIDLYGWGTSGYKNQYPYMVSKNDYDYRAKEDGSTPGSYCILRDITGTQYDWGVHNAITNGGNKVNIWRTLSYAEWEYLISKRSNASSKKALANVNGINGCVLLPDNWTLPSGCSFNPGVENGFSTNRYTVEQWKLMENAGAVFLPAAGCRLGTSTNVAGQYGFYWSTTDTDEIAHYFSFTDGTNDNTTARIAVGKRPAYRYRGKAVRLVKDVE